MKSQNPKPKQYSISNSKNSQKFLKEDDQTIWTNFKSGDEEAFILLYKKYANVLYGYGCRFSIDHEMVKDCLQDFFVYLREKREGLGNPTSLKSYLLKAFKRRVIDYLKKSKKEKERRQKIVYDEFPIERFYETIYIDQQEEGKLINLERALKSLNSKEREAIYYFYYQNLSYEEIADFFDYSHISSSRRLIYNALRKMRRYITFVLKD